MDIYEQFSLLSEERLTALGFGKLCEKKYIIYFSVCKVFEYLRNVYNIFELEAVSEKVKFAVVERICGEVLYCARNSGIIFNKNDESSDEEEKDDTMEDLERTEEEQAKAEAVSEFIMNISEPTVKEIMEGEVKVVFDTTANLSNSARLEKIIEHMRNYGDDVFASWRCIRW